MYLSRIQKDWGAAVWGGGLAGRRMCTQKLVYELCLESRLCIDRDNIYEVGFDGVFTRPQGLYINIEIYVFRGL